MADNKGRRLFNNRAREDRPRNAVFNVDLFEYGRTNKFEYDRDTLLDILDKVPFDEISIPVYTYKNLMLNSEARGNMVVGYIKDFDPKNEVFTVVIYGNYTDTIGNFTDAIIFPRVFIDENSGCVRSIIGLDICPMETYKHLYD